MDVNLGRLIRLTQDWALRRKVNLEEVHLLRTKAILENHAWYLRRIPAYRRLAEQEGLDQSADSQNQVDIDVLKRRMMLPDGIFKSYLQEWLDEGNFTKMNEWLSEIHHKPVAVDVRKEHLIEGWISRLELAGLRLVYSSGTSGSFSFVPRDLENWRFFRSASMAYLAPLLLYEKAGSAWQKLGIRLATRLFSPERFTRLGGQLRLDDFDAVFLDFQGGCTGNQSLEQELAPLFRRHIFLYPAVFSPTALRALTRGVKTAEDRQLLDQLQTLVVDRQEENYQRVIHFLRQPIQEKQKVFIFGVTQQFKELCEAIQSDGKPLVPGPGSLVLFGGGWKSFTGRRISRQELSGLMGETLGLPPDRILEGYSMTEINAFMLRCDYGRFHIPPFIEPVIFDEELLPLEGSDLRGIFGFLDPFARSYPGFLISGDLVHLVDGACQCGLTGPAVTEIGRAERAEIKGCGGILASIHA